MVFRDLQEVLSPSPHLCGSFSFPQKAAFLQGPQLPHLGGRQRDLRLHLQKVTAGLHQSQSRCLGQYSGLGIK